MNDLSGVLNAVGLTGGQAIGFAVTIAVTLLSASATRSSSKESKRQHLANQRLEQLSAAGSLLLGLNDFEQQLEERLYDNLNCSQMFDHHTTINGIKLREDFNELAAKLGEGVLVDVIRLEAKRAHAIRSVEATLTILGPEEAENEVIKHSAILILDAVALTKKLSEQFGTAEIVKPSMELERLQRLAQGVDD